MTPKVMNPKEEEWLHWHKRLNYLLYVKIRKLVKKRILSGLLVNLHSLLSYQLCAFGGSKKKLQKTKDKGGTI